MHGMRGRGRMLAAALGVVGTLVAAGCGGGSAAAGDKAGGSGEPVFLRLSNPSANLQYEPAVQYFVDRVGDLSGGALRIEVVRERGEDFAPGVEQQVVGDVISGEADLAWVGTRVLDTLGINSFRALTAPMLIDSYPLQAAVIGSDIPGRMLKTLDAQGLKGLAVLADGLRKPIAAGSPLLGPADWAGVTFASFRSDEQAAAVRALGASPSEAWGVPLEEGLVDGTIRGFEKGLLIYHINEMEPIAPYVTVNVNLWPQTVVLLANPDRFSGLSDQRQDWLVQAATDAAARSTDIADAEDQLVSEVCAAGGRMAEASAADIAGLQSAFQPVIDGLEQDAQTKAFMAEIGQLKQSTPAGPAVAIPADCTGTASQAPDDPIEGSWHTAHLTESELVRAFITAGGSEAEAHAFAAQTGGGTRQYAVISLTIKDGSFVQYESGDGSTPIVGSRSTYTIADDGTLTLTDSGDGCQSSWRYEVSGDTLQLHLIQDCPANIGHPYGPTLFGSFPFTRDG